MRLRRLGATIGTAALFLILWRWLPDTDVFIVHAKNCPPRAGTVWPFLLVSCAGLALPGYVIWGSWESFRSGFTQPTMKASLWWFISAAWTAGCLYTFARNISLPVVGASLIGAGAAAAALALFVVGGIGVALLSSIPARRRRKRAAADLAKIPTDVQRNMLAQIDEQARRGDFQLLYRPVTANESAVDDARIGGEPAALVNQPWPVAEDGKPALFLLQVPLSAPRLPPPWTGRLLTIFLGDYELYIRSYRPNERTRLTMLPKPADATLVTKRNLQPIAVPLEEDLSVKRLLQSVPTLSPELERYTKHPADVLSTILSGAPGAEPWSSDSSILSGGGPELIQKAHDAKCATCGQPMRFLLQFPDVTDELLLDGSGVGYVYGCDVHPDQCMGFVDCH